MPEGAPTPQQILAAYVAAHYRLILWKDEAAQKGPKEKDWQVKTYDATQYTEQHRVGLLLGHEVEPGHFLHDIDIDWEPGMRVALKILPNTEFVFGRTSKFISHCFYTANEPLPSYRYEDIDGTALLELRGTKKDGTLGYQTMVPPSIWADKEDPTVREPLVFRRHGVPGHMEAPQLKQVAGMAAMSMLLSKHLGVYGFGHEPRLAWAGFFLRLGFTVEELTRMGEAISLYCQNTEVADIQTVLRSTANRLNDPKQKVKGGPALVKFLGAKGREVIRRIHEWLGRDSDFVRNKDGAIIKDNQENIKRAFELLDVNLSHNEFSDKLLISANSSPKVPIEDKQLNALWFQLEEEFHFRPSFEFFDKTVRHLAWSNPFHPVREYLSTLHWDGTPRIDTWLRDYGGVEGYATTDDDAYLRAISGMVLVAAVRRVRSPGCKFDEMLVFESSQGMEKSSALRALCPHEDWFTDDLELNITSQKLIEQTLGKWIVEAADLAGHKRAEVEQLKAMLSRQVDGPVRMAYARMPIERPRQFILVGTTNALHYLIDQTGARRFWPVRVGQFNVKGIIAARDQLWAEAAAREAAGESIRLRQELWHVAGRHQEERREFDAWEDTIDELIMAASPKSDGKIRIATTVIWDMLGIEVARRDRFGAVRISEIMQRRGFHRKKVTLDGKTVVGYESGAVRLALGVEEESGPRVTKTRQSFIPDAQDPEP